MTAANKSVKYYFDENAANRPIRFIEQHLVHITSGQPLLLEDFQKEDIIRPAFGWKTKSGRRKHRFVYVEIPKGNGKSYLLSAITIFLCCAEGQKMAECYCAAGDKDQARIVFDTCKAMIEESPTLKDKFDIFKNVIIHKKSLSRIIVISAESYSKHGYRPYGIAFDELHVQPNRNLYDTITKGLIKIPNSMCWMITTAGVKNTFAEEIHNYALDIKKGIVVNPYWLPVIYAAAPKDDPFKEKTWKAANPGLDSIIEVEDFKVIAEEAKTQPTALNSFLRLHLNIWTGAVEAWIPSHEWEACNLQSIDEKRLKELENYSCWAGLDMASTEDLCGLAYLFEIEEDVMYELFLIALCPEDTILERTNKENHNYQLWVEQGYILATPGNTQSDDALEAKILEFQDRFKALRLGYDPWTADRFAAKLYTNHEIDVKKVPQTLPVLTQPSKWFEKRVISKKRGINHGGNPVMSWMMDNVKVYRDTNGNIRPHRGESKGKIDLVMATINAIAAMMDWKADPKNQKFDAESAISWIN